MCGINGIMTTRGGHEPSLLARVTAMAEAMAHRGPDGHGAWAATGGAVALVGCG